jgi:transcriptional regulator with XRE-family HTH domain
MARVKRSIMTSPQRDNPVVHHRRLRAELRKLRDDAGLVQTQVAKALDWSVSKLVRIETGIVGISKTDLTALLTLYAVTDTEHVDALVQLLRSSRQAAWWDEYKDKYPPRFITFLGYEASAKVIRDFHSLAVPDLLQTREYAREVITACGTPPEQIAMAVDVLIQRQKLLDQQHLPTFFFLIDEGALRRCVGGPAVMRNQLEWLKELNRRSNVTIQIALYEVGAYGDIKGSFGVYELPSAEDDYVIVLELANGDVLIQDSPKETITFMRNFSELAEKTASADSTDKIIDEIAASFADDEPTK